jgi:hypothetical protein
MTNLLSSTGAPIAYTLGLGRPISQGGPNVAAPAIITPPSGLGFNYATAKPGIPASGNQFMRFEEARDWDFNFIHPTEGFGGIRYQPCWRRADGFYGLWEPAEGELYRIQRKGASGAALQTLVLTCGPNPATVPVGDSVVIWDEIYNGGVSPALSRNLSGYALPLKTKMTVTGGAGSALWDTNGRRIIEVDAGVALPAIDYTPGTHTDSEGTWQAMRVRHWSAWRNVATQEVRYPLGYWAFIAKELAIRNGGHIIEGGLQGRPTWYDWTQDFRNFGQIALDLYTEEHEMQAFLLGDSDPRLLAVSLENEPTREYLDGPEGTGYRTLLRDWFYPQARAVWGQERTLIVKSTAYGTMDSLRDEFDFACPTGENAHLVTHNYDGQAHMPDGTSIHWGDIGMTDYYAGVLADKIAALGYRGGGMEEMGTSPFEWWDASIPVSETERGRRFGRTLTSLTNRGLYQFVWGLTGDYLYSTEIADIDGHRIEAFLPGIRQFGRRAGLITT